MTICAAAGALMGFAFTALGAAVITMAGLYSRAAEVTVFAAAALSGLTAGFLWKRGHRRASLLSCLMVAVLCRGLCLLIGAAAVGSMPQTDGAFALSLALCVLFCLLGGCFCLPRGRATNS